MVVHFWHDFVTIICIHYQNNYKMKKIFVATMLLACASGVTVNAMQANVNMETVQTQDNPVKPEELPEAVKTALSGEAYKDWTIAAASLVKEGETEYYKIQLTKGEEKQEVKLNKEGQAVK